MDLAAAAAGIRATRQSLLQVGWSSWRLLQVEQLDGAAGGRGPGRPCVKRIERPSDFPGAGRRVATRTACLCEECVLD